MLTHCFAWHLNYHPHHKTPASPGLSPLTGETGEVLHTLKAGTMPVGFLIREVLSFGDKRKPICKITCHGTWNVACCVNGMSIWVLSSLPLFYLQEQ